MVSHGSREALTMMPSSLSEKNLASQLLKLLAKIQCGVSRGGVASQPPASEYGYLQIKEYRRKRRAIGSMVTRSHQKRWLPLPKHIQVHGHSPAPNVENPTGLATRPLRPCLRGVLQSGVPDATLRDDCCKLRSSSSVSTIASSSDQSRVHFCDGLAPGCDTLDAVLLAEKLRAPLAEWIFIDRDACGCSLYEYDPKEVHLYEYEYFHSSPYGRMFMAELSHLHATQATAAFKTRNELYDREEQQLDNALRLAGVDELLLKRADSPQLTFRA